MERIWAPWRMDYINGNTKGAGCIFCVQNGSDRDSERLILYRSTSSYVIMNRYPYTNGHLLVCPYRHTADMQSFTDEEMLDLFRTVQLSCGVLKQAISPDGINMGMNMGKSAGAGVDDHLHIHIVPRWNGDTNFMTVVADARIVPESLDKSYSRLLPFFK